MNAGIDWLEKRVRNIEDLALGLEPRVTKLEASRGKAGTGACICKASPEQRAEQAARTGSTWEAESKSRFPIHAMLDHRCPKHGEKAQPAVWGRHRDKELVVTYAQWVSLGVTHEEPKT